jgi:hypothetical protein
VAVSSPAFFSRTSFSILFFSLKKISDNNDPEIKENRGTNSRGLIVSELISVFGIKKTGNRPEGVDKKRVSSYCVVGNPLPRGSPKEGISPNKREHNRMEPADFSLHYQTPILDRYQ